jgi:hemoglobin
MTAPDDRPAQSPYDLIGGAEPIAALVDRFYDLMDQDPAYGRLRALHAPDLSPMRRSLTGFLIGWLGGPRDWFEARPGVCMMSAHAKVPIDAETARQWTQAMGRALADGGLPPELAAQIELAFGRMAEGMARRGG